MTTHRCPQWAVAFCVLFLVADFDVAVSHAGDNLAVDLQKMVELGEKASPDLRKSIIRQIESDPKAAFQLLVPKLREAGDRDQELGVYAWALGLTGNPEAADELIGVAKARGKASAHVQAVCAKALADVGGPKAGAFLLEQLDTTDDVHAQFDLLGLLGQMQYQPAVPKMLVALKVDPADSNWGVVFVFGRMGDSAVPFLIEQVASDQRNVRFNAVMLLGHWLMAPEASEVLQQRFWKEDDAEIRHLILSALERTVVDLDDVARFSQEVAAKERQAEVRKFAQETLDNLPEMKAAVQQFKEKKQVSKDRFQGEYAKLYRSAGKEGLIGALSESSSLADEPQLRRLRERILRRYSDEALFDYREVNSIILNNRRALGPPATRPSSAPAP